MGLSNLFYNLLPQEKRDHLNDRKNVKLIKEFLRERKKLQAARKADIIRLKDMRKNRYIDKGNYLRLKEVMILTHEEHRIELINSITRKSARREGIAADNSELFNDEEPGLNAAIQKKLNDDPETQSSDTASAELD